MTKGPVRGADTAEVVLTVNSPGEVATWLVPVVRALRQREPRSERLIVTVMIVPCMYAAGTELEVVRSIPGVDHAIGPGPSLRFALTGKKPAGWQPQDRGCLVYLGGEVALARRMARRLGYPAVIYTEGYISKPRSFARIMVPNEGARQEAVDRGTPAEIIDVIGDLMVDAAVGEVGLFQAQLGLARGQGPGESSRGGPRLALFPGSRPYEVRTAGPLFVRAAAHMVREEPSLEILLALSPFVTARDVTDAMATFGPGEVRSADVERLFGEGGHSPTEGVATTPFEFFVDGVDMTVRVVRGASRAVMAAADLALTIPGSNTAEMAAHGLPMIVCIPLDNLEEIPIDGVLGLLGGLPLIGRPLKVAAVRKVLERTRFTALPNRVAGDFVVPELRQEGLTPAVIASHALDLWRDDARRNQMSRSLKALMGPPGASHAIAQTIINQVGLEEER